MSPAADLHVIEAVNVPGRGLMHIVANPGLPEPGVLAGREILLDGEPLQVQAVETFTVPRPYPPGLPFGVLLAVTWPQDRPVLPVTGETDVHEVRLDDGGLTDADLADMLAKADEYSSLCCYDVPELVAEIRRLRKLQRPAAMCGCRASSAQSVTLRYGFRTRSSAV